MIEGIRIIDICIIRIFRGDNSKTIHVKTTETDLNTQHLLLVDEITPITNYPRIISYPIPHISLIFIYLEIFRSLDSIK